MSASARSRSKADKQLPPIIAISMSVRRLYSCRARRIERRPLLARYLPGFPALCQVLDEILPLAFFVTYLGRPQVLEPEGRHDAQSNVDQFADTLEGQGNTIRHVRTVEQDGNTGKAMGQHRCDSLSMRAQMQHHNAGAVLLVTVADP